MDKKRLTSTGYMVASAAPNVYAIGGKQQVPAKDILPKSQFITRKLPDTGAGGLGRLGVAGLAGVAAGYVINKYGERVRKDIGNMSDKATAESNANTKALKDQLAKRKAETGKSLVQRQLERINKDSQPKTKSPSGIGVGWK